MRPRPILAAFAVGLAAITLLGGVAAARAEVRAVSGSAVVVDGDTLRIGEHRIRFHGIDAPESAQSCEDGSGRPYACGERATRALDARIGDRPVTCEIRDMDRYGRLIAVCRLGVEDLNAWMVRMGHALAYRRYSIDDVAEEDAARQARRGIWQGAFEEPWAWRRNRR